MALVGSPPRVREKPPSNQHFRQYSGITPACAGKTVTVYNNNEKCEDHPRVCGKNAIPDFPTYCRLGSPPRVREKHIPEYVKPHFARITPACAGKTWYKEVVPTGK